MKPIFVFGAGLIIGKVLFGTKKEAVNGLSGLSGFFDEIEDLVNLRKSYFDYMKQYHPDRHPDANKKEIERLTEIVQRINNEYAKLSNVLPKEKGQNFESKEDKENEFHISEVYKDIVTSVLKYDLIKVELIGAWVWISGNTYPIRSELKAAGFQFAPVKKMWYWRPEEKKWFNKGESQDIEKIRRKYGANEMSKDYQKSLSGMDMNLLNSLNALKMFMTK